MNKIYLLTCVQTCRQLHTYRYEFAVFLYIYKRIIVYYIPGFELTGGLGRFNPPTSNFRPPYLSWNFNVGGGSKIDPPTSRNLQCCHCHEKDLMKKKMKNIRFNHNISLYYTCQITTLLSGEMFTIQSITIIYCF